MTVVTQLTDDQKPVFTSAVPKWDTVTLDWQDNASNETAYLLYRSDTGSGGPYALVATLPSNTTSHTESFLPLTTLHYRLKATNSLNASATDFALCETNALPVSPGGIIPIDPVTGVIVSSEFNSRFGDYTVDYSGMDTNAWTHGGQPIGGMWLSAGTGAESITYDFGSLYVVRRFHVWNYNEVNGTRRGADVVTVEYGETASLGSTVPGITNFEKVPGNGGVADGGESFVDFAPFVAQFVKFDIPSHFSGGDRTGLSEVLFLGVSSLPGPTGTIVFMK